MTSSVTQPRVPRHSKLRAGPAVTNHAKNGLWKRVIAEMSRSVSLPLSLIVRYISAIHEPEHAFKISRIFAVPIVVTKGRTFPAVPHSSQIESVKRRQQP